MQNIVKFIYFEYNNFRNHLVHIMKILLFGFVALLINLSNALISQPRHEFVTLDTVTDKDFAGLMSPDWTQRLPSEVRKYKDQILAKLHMAHH